MMSRWLAIAAWFWAVQMAMPLSAARAASTPVDNARTIAVIPLAQGDVNQGVFRQVDRIVPQLKKLSRDKVVKLECRYNGRSDREQDVRKAYMVAGRIEKYLREYHRLNIELWIAAQMSARKSDGNAPSLVFAVFSDDIKDLQKLPVDPAGKQPGE